MHSGRVRDCGVKRALNRERWRGHVEAWLDSGLAGAAYCRRHGLRAKSLYRWREVFAEEAAVGAGPGDRGVTGNTPRGPLGAEHGGSGDSPARGHALFAEVRVTPEPSAGGVTVLLPWARRVAVAPGFDADTLARVVRVLEALSC